MEGVGFPAVGPRVHQPSPAVGCTLTRSCTLHLPGLSCHPEVIKHPTSAWAEADGLRTGHFLSGQSVSPRDQ